MGLFGCVIKYKEVTMSNNKQSSVELYRCRIIQLTADGLTKRITGGQWDLLERKAYEQAKAMHKKESIVFALLCMMPNMEPDKSTIATISNIYDEYFNK